MAQILVADDHELVRRGLRRLLESRPGLQICGEVCSGDEAVAAAERLRPDVVILDAVMPGRTDGLSATRLIRERVPGVEVLLFTMFETDEVVTGALASGASGIVLKSDPSRHLLAAVEALAQHVSFVSPTLSDAVVYRRAPSGGRIKPSGPSPLTAREREVARLLAHGRANREVAAALGVSVKTVESHRANILRKLEISSLVELVRYAVRNRLVEP
jgi:DNA-binding NarL/FixJ family response regulator